MTVDTRTLELAAEGVGAPAKLCRRSFLSQASAVLAAGAVLPHYAWADDVSDDQAASTPKGELRAQRLVWAGVKLVVDEVTLFIDAIGNTGIFEGAYKPAPVPLEAGARKGALVTHLHNDHFDAAGLKPLFADSGNVFVHRDNAATVSSRGLRAFGLATWEPFTFGPFTITPVPAVDGLGTTQVSWVVAAAGRKIFHGGDTLWHGEWWKIARQHGPFDVAFLPINAPVLEVEGGPQSEIPIALTPQQAVAAGVVLGAKKVVPIHYGASRRGYVEFPDAEAAFVKAAAERKVSIQVVQPGEFVTLP